MWKKLSAVALFLFFSIILNAQNAEDICGYWRTLKGNTQFHITKNENGLYSITIAWLRIKKERIDSNNPNPQLRNRKFLQLVISDNIVFLKDKNKWVGTIYDPESGNTYSCKLHFDKDKDILKLKGSVKGVRALAHETICIREKHLRKD